MSLTLACAGRAETNGLSRISIETLSYGVNYLYLRCSWDYHVYRKGGEIVGKLGIARLLPPLLVIALAAACGGDDTSPAATDIASSTPVPALGGPFGPGVTETEIRLGTTNDLTGVGDTPYAVIAIALNAYLRKANEEDGGACDRNVVLLAEDDQHSPELTLEKTRKLVEQDQVLAMVGGLDTAIHTTVAGYLNDPNADGDPKDGVPDLFVSTGWSGWGDVARLPWTIGLVPDYRADAKIQGSYMNSELDGKKVGALYENDPMGIDYLDGLREILSPAERLVSAQQYDPAIDLRSQVLAMRDAGAEAVLLAVSPATTAEAVKIATAEAFTPRWFISNAHSPSALAREIGGGVAPEQLANGFRLLNGATSTAYLLSTIEDAETPEMLEHQRVMETYDGSEAISTLSAYGQSLGELTIETLKRTCEDLTREGLLRAVESIRGFSPSLFARGIEVGLSPQDHYSVQTLQIVQIQADGTVTEIGEPISFEASTPDGQSSTPAAFP